MTCYPFIEGLVSSSLDKKPRILGEDRRWPYCPVCGRGLAAFPVARPMESGFLGPVVGGTYFAIRVFDGVFLPRWVNSPSPIINPPRASAGRRGRGGQNTRIRTRSSANRNLNHRGDTESSTLVLQLQYIILLLATSPYCMHVVMAVYYGACLRLMANGRQYQV